MKKTLLRILKEEEIKEKKQLKINKLDKNV
jgi:hypothetical protein